MTPDDHPDALAVGNGPVPVHPVFDFPDQGVDVLPAEPWAAQALNAAQAAEFLGIGVDEFRDMCRQGNGPKKRRLPRFRGAAYHITDLREIAARLSVV